MSGDTEVQRFASVLPIRSDEESFHSLHPAGALRRWVDVPVAEIRDELIRRNGRFQALLGWMRHTLQACLVLDASGRLIFPARSPLVVPPACGEGANRGRLALRENLSAEVF